MNFAPGMWLNPLPDSGNGFGAAISESAFAAAEILIVASFHMLVG